MPDGPDAVRILNPPAEAPVGRHVGGFHLRFLHSCDCRCGEDAPFARHPIAKVECGELQQVAGGTHDGPGCGHGTSDRVWLCQFGLIRGYGVIAERDGICDRFLDPEGGPFHLKWLEDAVADDVFDRLPVDNLQQPPEDLEAGIAVEPELARPG